MNIPVLLVLLFVEILVGIFSYFGFIKWLKRKGIGQYIRDYGPNMHTYKEGTPTAGGILFILIPLIFYSIYYLITKDFSTRGFIMCISLILFGIIGLCDDIKSVKTKNADGLRAYQKIILQLLMGTIILLLSDILKVGNTWLYVPFSHSRIYLRNWYYPFALLVFVSSANAVNLTDGLDGLAASTSIISIGGLSLLLLLKFGNTLELHSIFFVLFAIGMLLSFLWHNWKPATIFMGDSGSLALGGLFATIGILYGLELFLMLVGVIFVVETLSVIIQVFSYKTRGKRVFKMSPLHHHYELSGWSENKVVVRFCIVNILGVIIALLGFLCIV